MCYNVLLLREFLMSDEQLIDVCPYCNTNGGCYVNRDGSDLIWMTYNHDIYQVHCSDCEMYGPYSFDEEYAIDYWNSLPREKDGSGE